MKALIKKKEKTETPLISLDILEALAKFQEIELDDVEISFDELELSLTPSMMTGVPRFKIPSTAAKVKPTSLLEARIGIPVQEPRAPGTR